MSKPTIQVVAYRRATSSDSIYDPKPYYLDIQDAPNISINFNFEDIKNPESRKTDFSHTFKLPMSDVNNQFFEHWYNVNIAKLIYTQNELIEAQILVNGQPVLTGNLKLQGVYKKAGYYDVAVIGKVSTLFTAVGSKTVREAFTTPNATDPTIVTEDDDLKHTWTPTAVQNSWTGDGSVTFNNTSAVSLRDTTANVNKVIYPITGSKDFRCEYDSNNTAEWLNNQVEPGDTSGGNRNWMYHLPPAIQLRTILEKIFAKAGFRWSSTFLDSGYFRKIFMTTMDHDETAVRLPADLNPVYNGNAYMIAPTPAEAPTAPLIWGVDNWSFMDTGDPYLSASSFSGPAVTSGEISANANFPDLYEFTPLVTGVYQISITSYIEHYNAGDGNATGQIAFGFSDGYYTMMPVGMVDIDFNGFTDQFLNITTTVGLYANNTYRPVMAIISDSGYQYPIIELGGNTLINGHRYEITVLPEQIGATFDQSVVNPPAGINPDLKQSDFLKDIIQRFNLVVSADKQDPSLLYVEPFNDFIGTGEVRNWDQKIDDEKELLLKPTTDLVKKGVHFTDKESEDFLNKVVKEEMSNYNVWGHYKQNFSNPFSKDGEYQNKPVLAPFLVNRAMTSWQSGDYDSNQTNFVFNNQASYNDNGSIKEQKSPHKLFYYNGMPTTLDSPIYMLNIYTELGSVIQEMIEITTYPLCSAYELPASNFSANDYGQMRTLFWNYNRNDWMNATPMFNGYQGDIPNGLYNKYWKQYIQELYSEDSRILELNIYLTPLDIANFDFRDIIYLKGTYWRVLKLTNYEAGTTSSTKMTLLKSPDLNGMVCWSDLCDNLQYQITVGGSAFGADYYIQIEDGSGGFTALMSPECCECFGGTPLGSLNPTFCLVYGEYSDPNDITITSTDDPLVPEMMPGQPTGSGIMSIMSMGTNLIHGGGLDVKKIKVLTQNNYLNKLNSYKFKNKDGVITEITQKDTTPQLNYERNEFDIVGITKQAIGYISLQNTRRPITINPETITAVNALITCVVVDGAVDSGKVATFNIDTAFKITESSVTKVGAGNITTTIQSDLSSLSFAFALEYQSLSGGKPQLIIKVVTTGADDYTCVQWAGKMTANTIDILNSNVSAGQTGLALYESVLTVRNNILLEDNNELAWN
tara:strand:+ start:5328 stop:8759 length:3432 start_codon:yes stop_codon:yes gene_type:complete